MSSHCRLRNGGRGLIAERLPCESLAPPPLMSYRGLPSSPARSLDVIPTANQAPSSRARAPVRGEV
jgi:hypothetical protein